MPSLFLAQFFANCLTRLLAFADGSDPNASNLLIVVVLLSIIVVTAIAAIVPVNFARWRRHRYTELIVAATVAWALLLAGISIWAFLSQHQWSQEYLMRVESGYYDPKDLHDAPRLPWIEWAALAAAYAALIVFSRLASRFVMASQNSGRKWTARVLLGFFCLWVIIKVLSLAAGGISARSFDVTNPSVASIVGIVCLIAYFFVRPKAGE